MLTETDSATRNLRVRTELPNPKGRACVPACRFRPVQVRLGRELGDKLEVLQGLQAGQQVVASASS